MSKAQGPKVGEVVRPMGVPDDFLEALKGMGASKEFIAALEADRKRFGVRKGQTSCKAIHGS